MQRNIGSHPLMSRVQAKLYERLSNDHDRVTLELREKEEELARIKKRREDVGVELYVQQKFASPTRKQCAIAKPACPCVLTRPFLPLLFPGMEYNSNWQSFRCN